MILFSIYSDLGSTRLFGFDLYIMNTRVNIYASILVCLWFLGKRPIWLEASTLAAKLSEARSLSDAIHNAVSKVAGMGNFFTGGLGIRDIDVATANEARYL